jgi:hypothetical protein
MRLGLRRCVPETLCSPRRGDLRGGSAGRGRAAAFVTLAVAKLRLRPPDIGLGRAGALAGAAALDRDQRLIHADRLATAAAAQAQLGSARCVYVCAVVHARCHLSRNLRIPIPCSRSARRSTSVQPHRNSRRAPHRLPRTLRMRCPAAHVRPGDTPHAACRTDGACAVGRDVHARPGAGPHAALPPASHATLVTQSAQRLRRARWIAARAF